MLADFIWTICKKIELRFGYNRRTEIICAIITYLAQGFKLWFLFLGRDKLIIVTAWMPAYIENISQVLSTLKAEGFKVVIFPEWQKKKEIKYNQEMTRYKHFKILYDAHRSLPFIKSRIFISSTATKHFYFSNTNRKYFYFHSVAGLNGFPTGGLDDYSDFFCATDQQLKELDTRFKSLGLSKGLHRAGYPKYDLILDRIKFSSNPQNKKSNSVKTVLLAPSYASDDIYPDLSLLPFIDQLINRLLQCGYKVIFRPHPVSLRRGKFVEIIGTVRNLYSSNQNFCFDDNQDYFETYLISDVMVTDVSGTSLVFNAAFNKAVLFYTPNPIGATSAFHEVGKIGPVLESIDHLLVELKKTEIHNKFYPPKIFNPGNANKVFLEVLRA
jgi:hypothetical protein